MPNAWLNHVRQLRKNNRNMSYKQLLKHAKNSYSGGETKGVPPTGIAAVQNMIKSMSRGGSVQANLAQSSLTRSATTLGGRRSRKTRRRRR